MNYSSQFIAKCGDRSDRDQCVDGIIIPFWDITSPSQRNAIGGHAVLYALALAYFLFGAGIVTNRLVVAGEVITSQKRTRTLRGYGTVKAPIWSPAVAALMIHAISWSSLEILLPTVEVFGNAFHASQIGSSMIVGSSSFQLFFGYGLATLCCHSSGNKRIRRVGFFVLTALLALMSYLWVYLLLGQSSPGDIALWEAIIQLAFYPVTIFVAWAFELRLPDNCIANMISRKKRGILIDDVEMEDASVTDPRNSEDCCPECSQDWDKTQVVSYRHKMAVCLRKLKETLPRRTEQEIEQIASIDVFRRISKCPAYYRLRSTSALTLSACSFGPVAPSPSGSQPQRIGFIGTSAKCYESSQYAVVSIERLATIEQLQNTQVSIVFITQEGTAKSGVNYQPCSDRVVFARGQQVASIRVQIFDHGNKDANATTFLLKLPKPTPAVGDDAVELIEEREEISVSILKDVHGGVFMFESDKQRITSISGHTGLKVVRLEGAHGSAVVPYIIRAKTAHLTVDFEGPAKGILNFPEGQVEAFIDLKLAHNNSDSDDAVKTLEVELFSPDEPGNKLKTAETSLASINTVCQVEIVYRDKELDEMIDRLIVNTIDFAGYVTLNSSWLRDLKRALLLEPVNIPKNTIQWPFYYAVNILAMPWQFLIALAPPFHFLHGWLTWLTLQGLMILVAILVYDCAIHFSCTIGLNESITAITIVAVIWALPALLANRLAATREKTADVAVARLAGITIVTVSLGMGLSWTIGALKRTADSDVLKMPKAEHGFDMMLHCIFLAFWTFFLLLRRLPPMRGELPSGRPSLLRWLTGLLFIAIWMLWIVLSVIEMLCIIAGT